MKLFAGLGNPGKKHVQNRHNVGFLVLDALVARLFDNSLEPKYQKKFDSEIVTLDKVILAKPQTYMNSSGKAVSKLVNFYKIKLPNLWLIHDDLDINLGQYKIQKGVGPKLHNGVESVEKSLGKKGFWRVRVGVDNRQGERRMSGEEYVLQNFVEEEKIIFHEVIDTLCGELLDIIKRDLD